MFINNFNKIITKNMFSRLPPTKREKGGKKVGNIPPQKITFNVITKICRAPCFLYPPWPLPPRLTGPGLRSPVIHPFSLSLWKILDRKGELCEILISSGESREKYHFFPVGPVEPEPAALANTFLKFIKCIWRNAVGYGRCVFL
jgi:hypothetical protein